MVNRLLTAVAAALVTGTTACGVLEPRLPTASPSIQSEWPLPPTTGATPVDLAPATAAAAADIGWRDFFIDAKLEELVARALANNRDLRVAMLNVERAQAQYGIQRADRVPTVGATAALVRRGGDGVRVTDEYTAGIGVTGFELDLFGRVRNLSEAALQRYFAEEEARRSAQLSLIAQVAITYLTLAADHDQMRLAQATLKTREESHALTEKRHELGAVSALDVNQSRTQVEGARADLSRYAGQVAQDFNALNLLVGGPIDASLLPTGFDEQVTGLEALPAELPSEVLLRRPDVLQAEHLLRAANANIGAARAAFFPSITLTGTFGTASDELSSLVDGGTAHGASSRRSTCPYSKVAACVPTSAVHTPIVILHWRIRAFHPAGLSRGRRCSRADHDVVDSADSFTGARQCRGSGQELSLARYEAGRDSYLVRLEAQRTLYVAQQALITTRLAEQSNRVTLYKVLGGGWQEHGP